MTKSTRVNQQNGIIAGNTSTGILKLLALAFMMTDHMGKMLFPQEMGMRAIGRLAFPLYAWCIVVGFHYTRSVMKYSLRILITGMICQIPYLIALGHYSGPLSAFSFKDYINSPNIFLTLFLGLVAVWGIRDGKSVMKALIPILALLLAEITKCDYGWQGVLLIVLLYVSREKRVTLAAVMISFCLYWGSNSFAVTRLFGITINMKEWPRIISAFISPFMRLQAMAVFALPLILVRFKDRWKMPVWLSYILYPAHLIVLIILERIFI